MYILKNALRSVSRAKTRNILIGIIALILALSCCIGLSIKQAANTARIENLENLNVTAQISYDRSKMMQNAMNQQNPPDKSQMKELMQGNELSIDELTKYSKAESVDGFYYSLSASLNGNDDLESVSQNS